MKTEKDKRGQYITAPEIANLMISLIPPNLKRGRILEPCYGTGVFLELLYRAGYEQVFGYELDPNLYKLMTEKFPDRISNLKNNDYLKTTSQEKFDVIIGNPPYVYFNNIEPEILEPLKRHPFWIDLINGEWDLLYFFIVWSIEKLNPSGELIFITPYYWFNSTYAASLRKYVLDQGNFDVILHFGEMNLFKGCAPNTIIFKFIKGKTRAPLKIIEYKERKGVLQEITSKIETILQNFPEQEFEDETYRIFRMDQFQDPYFWYLIKPSEQDLCDLIEKTTLWNVPELNLYKGSLAPKKTPLHTLLDEKDLFSFNLPQNKFHSIIKNRKKWYVIPPYQNNYLKLKHVLTVFVGMVTGFDLAFRLDRAEIENLNAEEKCHLIRCVKGQNCGRFFINDSEDYIYLDDISDEKLLMEKFPNIYSKLMSFKEELAKRYNIQNKEWFHWATIRNKEIFEENFREFKIFVPNLDRHKQSRFSLSKEAVYGSGDTLAIVSDSQSPYKPRENLKYITAWLNSTFIQKWYQVKGSRRGHRTQYTQSYVEEMPIRLLDWQDAEEVSIYNNIVSIVDEILELKEAPITLENELERNFSQLLKPK